MERSPHKLFIGIDGGGTKTIGAMADETGTILAECTAGRSSIVGVPSAESCTVLQSVRVRLCEIAGIPRREALALVARMIDGRAAVSPLKEAILACLDHPAKKDYAEIVFLRKYSQPQLAAILPAVLRVAEAGDSATQSIVERAIADYVCTAVTIVRKTGSSSPDVVFGGGRLLSAPEWFMMRIVEGVLRECPGARIRRPELSPAIGAVIMAAHAGGCAPTRFFPARSN